MNCHLPFYVSICSLSLAILIVGLFPFGVRDLEKRIVERVNPDGEEVYLVQQRFLFVWMTLCWCDSLQEAQGVLWVAARSGRDWLESVPRNKTSTIILEKLDKVFRERLAKESDPEAFLRGLSPEIMHASSLDWQDVINHSSGAFYVLDSPVKSSRFIAVERNLALKILALGGLP